jgi:hypothetical protein
MSRISRIFEPAPHLGWQAWVPARSVRVAVSVDTRPRLVSWLTVFRHGIEPASISHE